MRRHLTEREAYKRLGILEKHSSFKQPYKFRAHPLSELNYEFPGYPRIPVGAGGDFPPWPDWGYGIPCPLACNPSMLDCDGGCTFIACICGTPPLFAKIAWDDGGQAAIAGTTPTGVKVCTGDANATAVGEYPTVGVEIHDGKGDKYVVEVALVDCEGCCPDSGLSGPATVNPDAAWVGTVSEPCPGGTCEAVSNSGCAFPCAVNSLGTQVTVAVGADDCGSFTVTLTDSCEENSWSAEVRINNTGQGGEWVKETSFWCWGTTCGDYCVACKLSTPVPECDFQPPASEQPPWEMGPVVDEQYKYGLDVDVGSDPCEEPLTYECNYNTNGELACDGEPPNAPAKKAVAAACIDPGCDCDTGEPQCDGTPSNDYYYFCSRCEWECTC